MSAEERREMIIRVAACEFSTGGYRGTTTESIAHRAGISQPYIFRLFPGKKALFLASAELCFARLTVAFEHAADGLEGRRALQAMSTAHETMTAERCILLLELQLYVACAAEPDIARLVNRRWTQLREHVLARTGAAGEKVDSFFADRLYTTTQLALDTRAPGHPRGDGPAGSVQGVRRCGCTV
jgi:AcrR family transcriptional regulator